MGSRAPGGGWFISRPSLGKGAAVAVQVPGRRSFRYHCPPPEAHGLGRRCSLAVDRSPGSGRPDARGGTRVWSQGRCRAGRVERSAGRPRPAHGRRRTKPKSGTPPSLRGRRSRKYGRLPTNYGRSRVNPRAAMRSTGRAPHKIHQGRAASPQPTFTPEPVPATGSVAGEESRGKDCRRRRGPGSRSLASIVLCSQANSHGSARCLTGSVWNRLPPRRCGLSARRAGSTNAPLIHSSTLTSGACRRGLERDERDPRFDRPPRHRHGGWAYPQAQACVRKVPEDRSHRRRFAPVSIDDRGKAADRR